jgi:hypothetical protein
MFNGADYPTERWSVYAKRPALLRWRVYILLVRRGRLGQHGTGGTGDGMCEWGDWVPTFEVMSYWIEILYFP